MPPKNYEISGHYFLVCVLSHQRKRCHRRRRCRSTTINCKTARIFVQKFFCDRLGSLVWSLVDCSVASSQVELVTGILRPRPEAPSGNESKLSWLIWSESPLCWSPLRQCQVVKYFFALIIRTHQFSAYLLWSNLQGYPSCKASLSLWLDSFYMDRKCSSVRFEIRSVKTSCFNLILWWAGLCGAEIVGRKSVGASEGFLGWIAYLVSIFISRRRSILTLLRREPQMLGFPFPCWCNSMVGMLSFLLYFWPVLLPCCCSPQ